SLATSNPAQRATSSSTVDTSPWLVGDARQGLPRKRPQNGGSQQQFLVPGRPPHQSYHRALTHQGKPSLAGPPRFSSLVAATGHGGLISNHALTAVQPCVSAGRWRP